MKDIKLTSEVIKEMRQASGLSQGRLAVQLGCSQGWISAWEVGYGRPSAALAEKLLYVFADAGVDLSKWEGPPLPDK